MDSHLTRRRFLETSAALLGVSIVGCDSKTPPAPQSHSTAQGTIILTGMQPLANGIAQPFTFPNGEPGLVFKTSAGQSGAVSAKCTHSGCTVEWNAPNNAKTPLRCPCHESYFALDGNVLSGPAKEPLTRYTVQESVTNIILTPILSK